MLGFWVLGFWVLGFRVEAFLVPGSRMQQRSYEDSPKSPIISRNIGSSIRVLQEVRPNGDYDSL